MNETVPEFSRVVNVDRLPPSGIAQDIEASAVERAALAKRFDLIELSKLSAELSLTPSQAHSVRVTGKIAAEATQSCVVSLEPLPVKLDIGVDVLFIPDAERDAEEEAPLEEGDGEIEYFLGGKIDLGELAAQYLGVNLDPYPRKPDASLPATEFGPKPAKIQPFAQLAELAKGKKNADKSKH